MNKVYEIGQIWEYQTRSSEEKSRLTIVAMTKHENFGTIFSVHLDKLKIIFPHNEDGLLHTMTHIPCTQSVIDKSVTNLIEVTKKLPDYEDGYQEWKSEFDKGNAGVFGGTIMEIIATMETSFNAIQN